MRFVEAIEEFPSGREADPEEAKLVQLISLLRLENDEVAARRYQEQLDALRKARLEVPMSVDAAMAARDAAAQELDIAVTEADDLQKRLDVAKRVVANRSASYDQALAAYTKAVQDLAKQVAGPTHGDKERPQSGRLSIAKLLQGETIELDDEGLFGLEALEDYDVQETDREETEKRKAELQTRFRAMAQEAFGQFANEAKELERQQKALKDRLLSKKRKTGTDGEAATGQAAPSTAEAPGQQEPDAAAQAASGVGDRAAAPAGGPPPADGDDVVEAARARLAAAAKGGGRGGRSSGQAGGAKSSS